jgi:hypothetical protein
MPNRKNVPIENDSSGWTSAHTVALAIGEHIVDVGSHLSDLLAVNEAAMERNDEATSMDVLTALEILDATLETVLRVHSLKPRIVNENTAVAIGGLDLGASAAG